ncbi:MAG TPA: translation initiation factor IF-2 [Gemmatimonadaceae bacterium]|nr:translation initiation factor IF-2 [Gemmatimonadaceae bacterium]
MIKLRVHDLAGEFGVSTDEVISLLRQMDVPVRSHMSELTDDQVARLRARWEREKRARATQPAPAPSRRRRGTAAAAAAAAAAPAAPATPAPTAAAEPAESASPKVRRRRAADVAAAAAAHEAELAEAAETPAPSAPATEALPPRPQPEEREEAVVEAPVRQPVEREPKVVRPAAAREAEVEERETAAPEPARAPEPVVEAAPPAPAAPVRPAAVRPPTPAAPTPAVPEAPRPAAPPRPTPPAAPAAPAAGPARPQTPMSTPAIPARPADGGRRPTPVARDWQRPRPGQPTTQRPSPVASSAPYSSPRPVASAAPGTGAPGARRDDKRGGKRKKGKRGAVDQEAVTANISRTMSAMRGAPARRGGGRREDAAAREEIEAQRRELAERERKTVHVNEFITVSELADILKIPATQIVAFAFKNLGLMVTINQRLDFDQIELIASEFGFQAVREAEYAVPAEEVEADQPEDLEWRPPVVTIMGHVDHGKTSLLDYIRKANVVAGEAGGITQHIGAYHVTLSDGREITFLDTPGHEAFTAMRARGAQVTDIVVLVVAADDQVMPQTVEAISHARNAGVPLVVAINKIDLPAANVQKVKQDLLQHGVVLEEFGGQTLATPISAKKGTNVPDLLDQVLLQAEILDLKANPNRRASGTVVEAQLDPGKGPVATVLVQNGTLRVGDDFICGMYSGRVRALLDERGKQVKEAGPAIPVQVLGIEGVPMAGDQLLVVADAGEARDIAQRRERLDREAKSRRTTKTVVSLEDFMSQAAGGERRTLKLVIKADQGGPAEALADALQNLSNDEVQVEIIQRGVGAISEGDILLAKAAGAVIIGFHVRPDNKARAAAEREGVDIKLYRIIYEAVDDVRAALVGMLRPEEREVIVAEVEVREIFRVPRIGVVAGCFVRSGIINRQNRVRIIRDGIEVFDGTIGSLRRFKDDVREVREGYECGIGIENFNDLKVGDVIESYRTEEVARTLQPGAGATA